MKQKCLLAAPKKENSYDAPSLTETLSIFLDGSPFADSKCISMQGEGGHQLSTKANFLRYEFRYVVRLMLSYAVGHVFG